MRRFPWFVGGLLLLAFSCTDEDGARHALRIAGYKDVRTTGYAFWVCGESDTCTGFVATAPNGEHVEGAVDCGFWSCSKGCTVRVK